MAAPAVGGLNSLLQAFLIELLANKVGGGLTQGGIPGSSPQILQQTSGSKYLIPTGDVASLVALEPGQALQRGLINRFTDANLQPYDPMAIANFALSQNRQLMRDAGTREIAKAQLQVQQATNPQIAKSSADVTGAQLNLLNQAIQTVMKDPSFTSAAARQEVARAF